MQLTYLIMHFIDFVAQHFTITL